MMISMLLLVMRRTRTSTSAKRLQGLVAGMHAAAAVLGRMRLRDTQQRINAKIPKNLPLIEVDPVLIAQLIGNLLDNALRYAAGPGAGPEIWNGASSVARRARPGSLRRLSTSLQCFS